MYEVLVFGDSLTRGADPGAGRRHDFNDRWPNVLQAGLLGLAHVMADGLGGRTTIYDDFEGQIERNGSRSLPVLLASHNPVDLIIIMLGSNDLKPAISGNAEGVANGIGVLLDIVERSQAARGSLIVSPPHFVESPNFGDQPRGGRSVAESQRLAPMLQDVATRRNAWFFDASTVAAASRIDGVHLDRMNTRAIGEALTPIVRHILTGR